jgi:hypothetical protein
MQTSQAATVITISAKDLPVAVAPHARERDQREVGAVQHQLEAQQHHERVAPVITPTAPSAKTIAETARYQAMLTARPADRSDALGHRAGALRARPQVSGA